MKSYLNAKEGKTDLEARLSLTQNKLNEVESLSRIGSWDWDLITGELSWSDQEFRLLGLEPHEAKPSVELFLSRIHPDDRPKTEDLIKKILNEGEFESLEIRVPRGESFRTLFVTLHVFREKNGKPTRLFGITQDFTDKLRIENCLINTRDLFGSLLETKSIGVCTLDSDLRITLWNYSLEQMTGLQRDQVLGIKAEEVFPFVKETGELKHLQDVLSGDVSVSDEKPFTVPLTDKAGYYRVARSPLRDRSGNIIGVLLIVEDVSQFHHIKKLERALLDAGERLSATLEKEKLLQLFPELVVPQIADWCLIISKSVSSPILVHASHTDPQIASQLKSAFTAECVSLDSAIAAMNGLSKSPTFIRVVPDKQWDTICSDEKIRTALINSNCRSLIAVPLSSAQTGDTDGLILLGKCGSNFSDEDFSLARVLASRMAMALENANLYEKAQDAVRAREEMMAVVSHDLRSPLATIEMAMDLIHQVCDQANLPADLSPKEYMEIVERSLSQAQELVTTILDVSLIQRSGLVVRIAPHALNEVLQNVVKIFTPLAQSKEISLKFSSEVPADLKIPVDAARIMQAVSNVLGNALKFTPERGTISLKVESSGDRVRISIKDSGPGIPKNLLPRIFDRNWQKDRSSGGLGLGLFIAKGIVEAHRGEIWAESSPSGSTFIFELPRDLGTAVNYESTNISGH